MSSILSVRARFVEGLAAFALVTCLAALPARAQTTGSIEGRVLDAAGGALPGATIEVKSPSLQGSRRTLSEADGRFRLSLLPPGTYSVVTTMPGFAKREGFGLIVPLDKVVVYDPVLSPAKSEEVTVTAETVGVETGTSALGESLGQNVFRKLPTGRNYASIAQLAAGTGSDTSDARNGSVTVYGSTGLENSFLVDGMNTTGVEFGSQGKVLNFEFIQEVEVKTGGYEAEYGGATGGIVNVVTKSGGNDFKGDVFGYFDNDSLQADNEHVGEIVEQGIPTGFTRSDFGADLGGYVLKDRLWFFGAYDHVRNDAGREVTVGPASGVEAKTKTTRDLFSVKLTFRATEKHTIVGTVTGDPSKDEGAINDPIGPPATYEGTNDLGGTNFSFRYDGLFGQKALAGLQISRHAESATVSPGSGGSGIRYEDNRGDTLVASGGFGRVDDKEFRRTSIGGDATLFFGGHAVKAGIGWEKMKADVSRGLTGGQSVTILAPLEGDTRTRYQHFYWTTPTASLPNAPSVTFTAEPNHEQLSVYVQDRWYVMPSLTVNVGFRWENQKIVSKFGTTAFEVDHLSPRIGIAWDFLKDGKTKLVASYGQFTQAIPMDMNIRSFSAERNPTIYNFDPVSLVPNPAAESEDSPSTILGGYIEPVDPNLKAQYLDEITLGVEREIAAGIVGGVKGIYRRYARVIEDGFVPESGDYFIMNPGEGELGGAYPKAQRQYRGIELSAHKRFGGSFQFFASYLLSKLEGNYDGSFNAIKGQRDPNINSDFDYPEFLVNNKGPLSLDRRHQFKAQVTWLTPIGLSASLSGYVRSGAPRTRLGWFDTYGRPELFLTERGAEGRTPTNAEADLHVEYPIHAGRLDITPILDLFSLFDSQSAVTVDNRWAFAQEDNASPRPTNARYGEGIVFQDPRTLRLGVRVSF